MLPEGMPKLTPKERIILELLVGADEMYGLEIVEASNNEVGRGSVYVFLDRLEERGMVNSDLEKRPPNMAGNPRRLYKVTGHGKYVLSLYKQWEAFVAGQTAGTLT
jgi:DNA-binding PadR family transcriptional regulator